MQMKTYIQVYTGDGKGKTTAAIGLSIRAMGAGKNVFFAQFVKGQIYAEIKALEQFGEQICIKQYGLECFIVEKPKKEDIIKAQKGWEEVKKHILSGSYDLIILDEIHIAIYYKLLSLDDILETLKNKSPKTELVLTGRKAPKKIIDIADLVTEMKEIKHYYQKGVEAREGIEY